MEELHITDVMNRIRQAEEGVVGFGARRKNKCNKQRIYGIRSLQLSGFSGLTINGVNTIWTGVYYFGFSAANKVPIDSFNSLILKKLLSNFLKKSVKRK